ERNPPLLQLNLDRAAVFALLARTSALIYTLAPEVPVFGMPMSVIEAMTAGAAVILPDRPEARAFAGPGFRGYRSAADIAAQVRAVLAGGPAIEAERAANQRFARENFCDPRAASRFHAELRE